MGSVGRAMCPRWIDGTGSAFEPSQLIGVGAFPEHE
jgi:hypothetical protein